MEFRMSDSFRYAPSISDPGKYKAEYKGDKVIGIEKKSAHNEKEFYAYIPAVLSRKDIRQNINIVKMEEHYHISENDPPYDYRIILAHIPRAHLPYLSSATFQSMMLQRALR